MELLVATWTVRLVAVAALAVAGLSYTSGAPLLDSIDRALVAAFVFSLTGKWLMGWLETPETKLLRMRQRREAQRAKGGGKAQKPAKAEKGGRAAPAAKAEKAAKPAKPAGTATTSKKTGAVPAGDAQAA